MNYHQGHRYFIFPLQQGSHTSMKYGAVMLPEDKLEKTQRLGRELDFFWSERGRPSISLAAFGRGILIPSLLEAGESLQEKNGRIAVDDMPTEISGEIFERLLNLTTHKIAADVRVTLEYPYASMSLKEFEAEWLRSEVDFGVLFEGAKSEAAR